MSRRPLAVLVLLLPVFVLWAQPVRSHALQPAYLQISHVAADTYAVLWRVPIVAGGPMAIAAVLPDICDPRQSQTLLWDGAGFTARWTASCPDGLGGGMVTVDGLEETLTDVLVRVDHGGGAVESLRLTPDSPAAPLTGIPSWWRVAGDYFQLGVDHILAGIDHLLFVFALILLIGVNWRLVKAITAFTVAHSITLALAVFDRISLPPPPVEATIALSIIFLAAEIAARGQTNDVARRRPWIVAFVFGLIHGLGFAGALDEVGLPQADVPTALLTFNLGVEAGQLLFVAGVVAAFAIGQRILPRIPVISTRIAAYIIGSTACYWLIERVADFA